MKHRYLVGIWILCLIISGCSSIPFKKTVYMPLGQVDPAFVLKRFEAGIPEKINLLNSIVFEYNWQEFLGIGQIAINTEKETFMLVCLNPMGMKLFELSGDKDSTERRFVMEMLAKKGDLAEAVGVDIRRIYFDLVPLPDAEIIKNKYEIIFKQTSGNGRLEYVFAGVDGYLVKKKYYENKRPLWEVSYYEYQLKNGKLYPQGIILKNFKYDYRLIIRLKEIQLNE